MSQVVMPAPLWRRLVAAVYDGLLLLALWMTATLIDVILCDLLGLPKGGIKLQLLLFLVGLGFFGWFWTHGGQTLGMRSWRLLLRRDDGQPLRWPIAALRYALSYPAWLLAGVGMLWCLLDRRRRGLHDVLTGTEVVLLPKR